MTGDSFLLSSQTGTDFSYAGDLKIVNGSAAGLTFRADASGKGYTANIDSAGMVKLWRPGQDLGIAWTTIQQNQTYRLRVVVSGSNLRVFLNGDSTPVITANDSTYAAGRFGVNVYNGTGVVQNVQVSTAAIPGSGPRPGWGTDRRFGIDRLAGYGPALT